MTEKKQDIRAFWGALYDSLHGEADRDITREHLLEALDALEDMFRLRELPKIRAGIRGKNTLPPTREFPDICRYPNVQNKPSIFFAGQCLFCPCRCLPYIPMAS